MTLVAIYLWGTAVYWYHLYLIKCIGVTTNLAYGAFWAFFWPVIVPAIILVKIRRG
jgi:hypothetical protein